MSKKTRRRDLAARLDALYTRLPRIDCQRKCAISCGPIIVSAGEARRMREAAPERRPLSTTPVVCSYLTNNQRCSVYAVRPLICRVFGVVQRMSCMHGCVPDRWLSDHEFVAIAAEIEAIAGGHFISTADGLQPLEHGFRELATRVAHVDSLPPELAEHYATLPRGARALHGGRVLGVGPGGDGWIHLTPVHDKGEP